jgi:hypothetical protein
VKYAAKRTWPEKPKAWEFKGEAESAADFALDFASTQDLRLGTEIVVIERESDEADIQFFKVSSTSPYQIAAADPRPSGEIADSGQAQAASPAAGASSTSIPATPTEAETAVMPSMRPFSSMIFYMLKIGFIATAIIFALGMLLKYLRAAV